MADYLKESVAEILEKAKLMIQENLSTHKINATGKTSDSFKVEIYNNGVRLLGGGAEAAHVKTLEIGRSGGAVPMNFFEIIRQWIIDKGITITPIPYRRQPSENWQPKYSAEERGLNQLAFLISAKIRKYGTERHRNPRKDIYTNVVNEILEELRNKITQEIKISFINNM